MKRNDLVEGESFSEYRNRTGNVESEENEVKSPPAKNKKEAIIERRIKRLKKRKREVLERCYDRRY